MSAPDPRLRAIVEAAMEIGRRRREVLEDLRRALLRGDDAAALQCARRLTGIEEDDAERDCDSSRQH